MFRALQPDGSGCRWSITLISVPVVGVGFVGFIMWPFRNNLMMWVVTFASIVLGCTSDGSWELLAWVIALPCFVAIFFQLQRWRVARSLVSRGLRQSHVDYVNQPLLLEGSADGVEYAATALTTGAIYPSGAWRGYYTQAGAQHGVCEFQLTFNTAGEVSGMGSDDVGQYTIQGRHALGRVAFSKKYIAGSSSQGGVVRKENLGHTVEYRGNPARLMADGSPSLRGGVRGSWSIEHANGCFDGEWHLWPVMSSWMAAGLVEGSMDAADGDSECCVCFDQPIDTGLEPCGHVALCHGCAARLQPRRCPLCRTEIHQSIRMPLQRAEVVGG